MRREIEMTERKFKTTSEAGLDHETVPMRLWHKAKKLGTWDPQDIDFTKDREDWEGFTELEREVMLHLTAEFLGGEESVTYDLLPLIQTVAAEGRLEEEMYLTSFLFEEAKHVESFRRFLDEVPNEKSDLSRFHGENYQQIFGDKLPTALNALKEDPTPQNQAVASVTYNMIVEGVLAETGYYAFHSMLEEQDLLPGMREVAGLLKQDESRHLAFGVYFLSRLTAEHGDDVWNAIEARMNEMLPLALGMINETFDQYDELPFGLELDTFVNYATTQFQKRYARIEKARRETVDDINDDEDSFNGVAAE
ncbi:MAG: R2-like ligand-binding oxidase [Myxococcota bacterium]